MILFIDVETIEQTVTDLPLSDKQIKADIERYWEKVKFMPEFTKILTICAWTMTDGENFVRNLVWTEEEQIREFFKIVWNNTICGFNIKWFDLPFIIKRALSYGIKVPSALKVSGKKPREIKNVIDLQEEYKMWVFWSPGSLDLVCRHLWITSPKEGWIDGSMVQEYYNEGKESEIIEYCKRDVNATIELYKKFKKLNLI